MSEQQHTSGPWTAHDDHPEHVCICIRTEDGLPIATSYDSIGNFETTKANARLIAAAPELLDALETLWAASVGTTDEEIDARVKARLIMAKATGEAVPSSKVR